MQRIKQRYIEHSRNAQARGILFLLSFEEWLCLWLESGHWHERGWRKGQYCMARHGDKGAYELGNVRICLIEENRAERNRNYPLAGKKNPAYGKDYWALLSPNDYDRRKAETGRQFRGKPKTDRQLKAMSLAATSRRMIMRDGRRCWAYPDDPDYPTIGAH